MESLKKTEVTESQSRSSIDHRQKESGVVEWSNGDLSRYSIMPRIYEGKRQLLAFGRNFHSVYVSSSSVSLYSKLYHKHSFFIWISKHFIAVNSEDVRG